MSPIKFPGRANSHNHSHGVYLPVISSGFTDPSSLSGLIFWLDANDSGTITQAGGLVSQWNDKSVTGANFTQGTSVNQPAYVASAINGKPGIDFSGSGKLMVNSTANIIGDGTQPRTIYVVSKTSTYTNPNYCMLMSFGNATSGSAPQLFFTTNASFNYLSFSAAAAGSFGSFRSTSVDFATPGATAISLTYNGGGANAANYAFYKSNVSEAITTSGDDTYTHTPNWLGANDASGTQSNAGPICQFFVYNRVLNATERGQVQTWINTNYAL